MVTHLHLSIVTILSDQVPKEKDEDFEGQMVVALTCMWVAKSKFQSESVWNKPIDLLVRVDHVLLFAFVTGPRLILLLLTQSSLTYLFLGNELRTWSNLIF
jgi:hypothetical protein